MKFHARNAKPFSKFLSNSAARSLNALNVILSLKFHIQLQMKAGSSMWLKKSKALADKTGIFEDYTLPGYKPCRFVSGAFYISDGEPSAWRTAGFDKLYFSFLRFNLSPISWAISIEELGRAERRQASTTFSRAAGSLTQFRSAETTRCGVGAQMPAPWSTV